ARKTYVSALATYRQAVLFQNALKKQNVELASQELEKTKTSLAQTQKDLQAMAYLKFVPIAAWYYNDADHLTKAGGEGLNTATIVIDSLKPYADVLGLKGEGSFVMGSAENRIKTAVMTMGKITPRIDNIAESLLVVQKEIDAVDPNHYPTFIFGKKINTQLSKLQEMTNQSVKFVDEARPLIKVLPSLLGESEQKKYLVLFQNDKELRPTGGFITAYSIFTVDKGILKVERSDDIYNLDNSISNKPKAPEPILKYLPKVSVLNLRDSNLSPDYIVSMKDFETLYNKAGQKVEVDGIIAIDTYVLVDTIRILDDNVSASGITFTTKEDKRCDCPQVIYELEDNISRPVNYVKADRKGLIGSLMFAIMQKSLSSSPKVYWGPLFQNMLMQLNNKHIMVYLYDREAQQGLESLNAAGRIVSFNGDYLHINQANFAGGKANLFVKETVEDKYEVKGDGTIQKTVTINYVNNHKPSDCNLERGGLCLNAEMRDWFRVYVPKGSKLVDSKGSIVKVTTSEDLGKTVFEGFLTVRPLGKSTLTLTYTLPFKLERGSSLPALIQKQPGTGGNMYSVFVNGRKVDEFELFSDKELKLKI
ncbi:MAG: DUF4012 domain-containing protein, partial [Candidatus Levybacteria bacterium]|nr:DUF4012 domain-containing protein [Candidatus Levybacteria bacterium]